MASMVDAETAKFRELQSELQKLQSDLQIVMGQRTENEMVLQELELLKESNVVYKLTGPVLIKQKLEDARDTVRKRLEFIRSELTKIQAKMEAKEKHGNELALKIQQMQAQLQQTTAQAVRAIAEQHKSGYSS